MADHRRMADRRTLITGFVAGGVLCGIWLMPPASAGGDPPAAPAAEQTAPDPDDTARPDEPGAPGTPGTSGGHGGDGRGGEVTAGDGSAAASAVVRPG
ncbi:hypothetical protein [Streptomyces sp. YIM 98790]|uniref:hypothetical protein n=1 Tax=Streptomyces sp. YIM 98790 TaxID=2689077 RepID=UPI00140AF0E7|nr:hypothetical protein [Streptomyces sp. YIM 98790]